MLDSAPEVRPIEPSAPISDRGAPPRLIVVDLRSDRFPDDRQVGAFWSACAERSAPGTRIALRLPAAADLREGARTAARAAASIACLDGLDFIGCGSIVVRTPQAAKRGLLRGSFPYPRDGAIVAAFETVHVLRRKGEAPPPPQAARSGGRLSNAEWEAFFSGYWDLTALAAREAETELIRRLARMYAFPGELVLASGAADPEAFALAVASVGRQEGELPFDLLPIETTVANPLVALKTRRVHAVGDDLRLELDDGRVVGLLGVQAVPERIAEARRFLEKKTAATRVYLDDLRSGADGLRAYVHLKSRLHLNAHLIKLGLAVAARGERHRMLGRFLAYQPPAAAGGGLLVPSDDVLGSASPKGGT